MRLAESKVNMERNDYFIGAIGSVDIVFEYITDNVFEFNMSNQQIYNSNGRECFELIFSIFSIHEQTI